MDAAQPHCLCTNHAGWQKLLLFDNVLGCGELRGCGYVLSGWLVVVVRRCWVDGVGRVDAESCVGVGMCCLVGWY